MIRYVISPAPAGHRTRLGVCLAALLCLPLGLLAQEEVKPAEAKAAAEKG